MHKAVALNGAIFHGSRLIGPALAGLVIAAVGLSGAFYLNGLLVRRGDRQPAGDPQSRRRPRAGSQGQVQAILEGLTYVRSQPRIAAMLGFTALTAAFVFPNLAIMMPVYARDVLGVGVTEMGIVMAAGGAGALVGSMLL